jgi:hypothetical protein
MNDFSELEDQLRKLRPLPVSEHLVARIERALAASANCRASVSDASIKTRWRWPFAEIPYKIGLGFALASAAALLIFARIELTSPEQKDELATFRAPATAVTSTNATAAFVPAGFTRIVYSTRDEGLQFPAGSDQPMRRVHSQTREMLHWRNPVTGASLRVSYPSDEITFIPMSGE